MKRDILMARDCYDDCIAFLDEQLGRLLDELRGQGLLDNTEVIITSDHGEAFGDHGYFGHSYSLYLDEIGVPLVILSPGAPAGRVVDSPVSLRDLPATVVDLLGSLGRLTVPGPLVGGLLAVGTRAGAPGDHHPSPLGAGRRDRVPTSAWRAAAGTAGSRCPWWPRAIITSGTAWGPRCSTI